MCDVELQEEENLTLYEMWNTTYPIIIDLTSLLKSVHIVSLAHSCGFTASPYFIQIHVYS